MSARFKIFLKICMVTVFLTTACVLPGYTQLFYNVNIDDTKYYLSLNSELGVNSNTLTNNFIGTFYKGGFLDHSLKSKALDRLNTYYNILGYSFNTDLYLNIPGKKNNINYYAGFENRNLLELRFNKDLFHLVFFGNADFTNEFLILKNLQLNILNFQQIKAGINKSWRKGESTHVLTAGLGYNNGQNILNYKLPYGSIYTQGEAEFINVQAEIAMKRSDTVNQKFGAENGWGFSADVAYTFSDENNVFHCRFEDLGFIRWKKYSQSYYKDTIIFFDGIELSNLTHISSETISVEGADSIVNAFAFSKKYAAFSQMIPMNLNLGYTRYLCKRRLSLSLNFSHYFFSQYRPRLRFVTSVHIPVKNSVISIFPSAETGGYGRFNFGLGLSAMVNKKFYIEIQTSYLNSYLLPQKSAGAGGVISIIKTL